MQISQSMSRSSEPQKLNTNHNVDPEMKTIFASIPIWMLHETGSAILRLVEASALQNGDRNAIATLRASHKK
jgi:hypothetical protein